MLDRKEIDLLIRAQFKGQDDINKVTDKIGELAQAILQQTDAAKRGVGSMDSLRVATRELKEEQERLTRLATDVGRLERLTDRLTKQEERVKSTAKAYDDLKTKLAAQSGVTDAQQQRLTKLAAATETAQARYVQLSAQSLTLGDALQKAGVDTNHLAAAGQRLRSSATLLGSALAMGDAALAGYAANANRAAGSVSTLARASTNLQTRVIRTDEALAAAGVTTRRLVGELTALIGAYVGVRTAAIQAGESIEAFNTRDAIRNQLALGVGNDKAAIDAEYAYIRAQSDRIGAEFEKTARGYAKFLASASAAGRGREEIHYIAESFLELARVAGLSGEEVEGVFRALGQSFSIGKIQAEELNQLSERIPGVAAKAQQALKDQFPDLQKALKEGKVGAENLILIAEAYRSAIAGPLATAIDGLAAKQARMRNAVLDFKLAVADGGFADAYLRLLERLTDFLRSAEGKEFAQDVSNAFAAVADALVFVLGNLAELKLGLATVAGLWAAMKLKSVAGDFIDLGKAIGSASANTSGLTKSFAALSAFIIGWNIGSYLYDKFEIVRKAGAVLVVSYELAWSKIKFGAMELFEDLPRLAENAFKLLVNAASAGMRQFLMIMERGARALGMTGLADNIAKALDTVTLKLNQGIASRTAQIRKEAEADLKRIRDIGEGMLADAVARPAQAIQAAQAEPTARPAARSGNGKTKEPTEAEIAKRQRALEAITRALETLDAKIDRTQTETLSKQLEAIDTDYLALARRIRALGGKEADAFLTQLEDAVGQLKLQTTKKFNDKIEAEHAALLSRIDAAEAAAGRKDKLDLDARLAAIATSYAATYREIAEQRAKLSANDLSTAPADEAKRRLDAAVVELQGLERVKFAREELSRLEARYTEQVRLREGLIAAVRAQHEAGAIDDVEAARRINEITASSVPLILEAAAATREWALANRAAFATESDLQLFLAALDAATEKLKNIPKAMSDIEKAQGRAGAQAVDSGLNAIFDELGKVASRQESVADGFDNIAKAFGQFALQFLRDIAVMILKLTIFNAMKQQGGFVGLVGQAGAASVNVQHEGGIVGHPNARRRTITPRAFTEAPRYHAGGIAGMSANEYATILKEGEEVLKDSDPRNALNGGLGLGKSTPPVVNVRNVLVDDRSRVAEAMNSAEGEEVIMQKLRANIPTLRSWIKG